MSSSSDRSAPARRLGVRVAGEQHRSDHVDPHVGGLGGQDRGREELERVLEVELAPASGYSRASRRATSRARPFRVRGRPRAAAVGSGGGHRSRRLRRGPAGATGSLPDVRCLEIKRQMTPTDIAEVSRSAGGGGARRRPPPTRRPPWLDLVEGGRPGFAGLVAWEPGHDHPVAYAQVSRGNNSWGLELVVDPHHRDEMATIGPELLGAAVGAGGRGGRRPRPLVGVRADDRPRRAGRERSV